MIISPIPDRFVPSTVSGRGAAALSPAAPHPHSQAIASVAEQARLDVLAKLCGVAAPHVAGPVAAVQRFEEVQLFIRPLLHGSHHGAMNVGLVPQVVGEIRNV